MEWGMSGCHYTSSPPPERERRYQHKVSLVVRYFMIPCNICLILLATSTLGFAVLLFLNNCTLVNINNKPAPSLCHKWRHCTVQHLSFAPLLSVLQLLIHLRLFCTFLRTINNDLFEQKKEDKTYQKVV